MIKNNSYNISSQLGKTKRISWMNKFVPWYAYGFTPRNHYIHAQ